MKKIILFIIGFMIIFFTAYFVIDYNYSVQQNKESHNNPRVLNCIPGGPDKIIPSILIENKTHQFDLGNCIWIKN